MLDDYGLVDGFIIFWLVIIFILDLVFVILNNGMWCGFCFIGYIL